MISTPHIIAAGLNYRTAPVELRERVTFAGGLEAALREATHLPALGEAVILSTCNRVELYGASTEPQAGVASLSEFLGDFHGIPAPELAPHLYARTDEQAVRHLFNVAVGLDSMVLGEGQILAQVKEALSTASVVGTAQACLQELFQRALNLGKRARTQTGIARGAVSVSSAAVDLAKNTLGNLRGLRVLVIGAGEMSRQTLTHLVGSGVESVVVANRTFDHADQLAREFHGSAVRFDAFPEHLDRADIIVSSSAAPHPIITVDKLRPLLGSRRGRPLLVIDIAVPRDVEPEVAELDDVYLFDIDDLQTVCDRYRAERAEEAKVVGAMVAQEAQRFDLWLGARAVAPLLSEMRAQTEALCEAELEHWLPRMNGLKPEQREQVAQMMRGYTHKLLHGPSTRLREMAAEGDGANWAPAVRRLFGLKPAPRASEEE